MISTQKILKRLSMASRQLRQCSSSNGSTNGTSNSSTKKIENDGQILEIPSPPTNCCMSGCANCVWIQYAEEVSTILRNGSSVARDIIMKEVEDPNMRSFLEMELRTINQKTKK